ncbi:MAG TPA: NUDIX hydrolase [Candidatus Thermoplasmatota archaeon]|nr:NUDIX hydrolase [Candidatus Thermoplasmatota archaeon]
MQRKSPALTVDAVIVKDRSILLVQRKYEPFQGYWALPGGFVEYGETTEQAVIREVREETGLDVVVLGLQGVYSEPKRDPRGHTVSVVYKVAHIGGALIAGDDAAHVRYFKGDELPPLAFDHAKIVSDAWKM